MNSNKKQNAILILKNDKTERVTKTQQTQKIRNITNLQIRELGKKYYIIKEIFDKLNIKRDTLFYFGKELENQYKNQKDGIHLQTQKHRMKESLVCWYTQFFYTEIIQPNSVILKQLLLFNIHPLNNNKNTKNKTYKSLKCTRKAKISIDKVFNQDIKYLSDNQFNQSIQLGNLIIPNNNDILIDPKFQINTDTEFNRTNDQDNGQSIISLQTCNQMKQISKQSNKNDDQNNNENFSTISNILIEYQPNQQINKNSFHFQNVKINEEIDVFENGNMININSNVSNQPNSFFKL